MRSKVKRIFFLILLSCYLFYWNYPKLSKNTDSLIWNANLERQICNPYLKKSNRFQVVFGDQIYPKFMPIYLRDNLNFSCLNQNKKTNLILFWNKWFGGNDFEYGLGKHEPIKKNNCPVWNCELTGDRRRLNESDIIIFHMNDPIDTLPQYRHLNQRWVFYIYESPIYPTVRKIYKQYENLFNWSATFKENSDFFKGFNPEYDFSVNKTELAAIIVSNCNDNSKRLEYVKELQKYMSVSVFGKCGKPCPTGFGRNGGDDCKKVPAFKYKFYLAIENAICKNYVTKKFFNALRYNMILVVYGGDNYDRYVPKSGYINALDFDSPKALAEYLIYLDKNKTAYNSYFQWKRYIRFIDKNVNFAGICEMCIRLNLDLYEGVKTKVISDMETFWNYKLDCQAMDNKNFKLKNTVF